MRQLLCSPSLLANICFDGSSTTLQWLLGKSLLLIFFNQFILTIRRCKEVNGGGEREKKNHETNYSIYHRISRSKRSTDVWVKISHQDTSPFPYSNGRMHLSIHFTILHIVRKMTFGSIQEQQSNLALKLFAALMRMSLTGKYCPQYMQIFCFGIKIAFTRNL